MYRLRLVGVDQGEYTLLLQLILGDHMLRAHDGASYTYESSLGFWTPYNGLPSQSSLKYIKKYLLRLEGCFREHKEHVGRTDLKLLLEFQSIFEGNTEIEVYEKLEFNSIVNKGDGLLRRTKGDDKGKAPDGVGDAGKGKANEEDDVPPDNATE